MTTAEEHIQRLIADDPKFAQPLAESDAELSLAMQTAALRQARGLTQRQLALAAGMQQPAVARYEKAGRTPAVSTLWRFATALNVEFRLGPNFAVDVVPLPSVLEPGLDRTSIAQHLYQAPAKPYDEFVAEQQALVPPPAAGAATPQERKTRVRRKRKAVS